MSVDFSSLIGNIGHTGNLAILRWLVGHAAQVEPLAADLQAIAAATTIDDKWTATKAAGDLIVTIIHDFPGLPTTTNAITQQHVDELLAMPTDKIGDGTIIKTIGGLLSNPDFIANLIKIIGLFGGVKA